MVFIIIVLSVTLIVSLAAGGRKRVAPTRTEQQSQDEELISVVLPTIHKDS